MSATYLLHLRVFLGAMYFLPALTLPTDKDIPVTFVKEERNVFEVSNRPNRLFDLVHYLAEAWHLAECTVSHTKD